MNDENENIDVSFETSEPDAQEIDYTQDLQSINDALQGFATPLETIIDNQEYIITLQEQINSQSSYHMATAYFAFCLVMFELFRFIKGIFKGVQDGND